MKASDLVQSLEQRAQAGAPLLDIDGDARLQMLLHAFCSGLIGRYLRDGGIALAGRGLPQPRGDARASAYSAAFRPSLLIPARASGGGRHYSIDGDRIEVCRNLTAEALAETRQAILVEYPKFRGLVDLLEHCTARYRQALSGEIPSISVLYPDGTSTLMDARRRDTPEYTRDGLYLALTAQVLAHLASRPGGTKLRILEVGGGSGGLTRAVLAALRGHAVDYCFTDVSRSFVRRAETEAAAQGITGIRFGLLDIARDPEPQGYPPRGFDVVCGYNVVHATPRMEESVASLRRLLAPGGLMMLVETTRLRRWDEMVWGLAEGWWHFADTDLRTDLPLISLDAWEELLRRQGFAAVAAYPRAAAARRASDVGLIMARAAVDKSDASPPTAAEHARTLAAIEAVRAIRRLGGDIMVIRADVADEDQVRTALSAAEARFGAPHGIIHTAGILGQGLIQAKTPEQARAVFGAKANGILTLERSCGSAEWSPTSSSFAPASRPWHRSPVRSTTARRTLSSMRMRLPGSAGSRRSCRSIGDFGKSSA